jgi:hypothetical protein
MSIKDFWRKSNPVVNFGIAPSERPEPNAKIYYWVKPFYNLLLILVIASIFFALGRLSAIEDRRVPIKIEYSNQAQGASTIGAVSGITNTQATSTGEVIGSKSGKKYYFPWCGTVKMIKLENQVKFSSIEEARNAGYLPASNCKGLK